MAEETAEERRTDENVIYKPLMYAFCFVVAASIRSPP